jgi:hypothetical protein
MVCKVRKRARQVPHGNECSHNIPPPFLVEEPFFNWLDWKVDDATADGIAGYVSLDPMKGVSARGKQSD